jgi:hypothetical protein
LNEEESRLKPSRAFSHVFRFLIITGISAAVFLGCSEQAETNALCGYTTELESSLVATGVMIDSLGSIPPRQMQSTIGVLTGTLSIMVDVAPSAIRRDVEVVERSYVELAVALENVFWDGSIANADAATQQSISNLTRNDNIESLSEIRVFVADQCSVNMQSGINAQPNGDMPVTSNSFVVEPQEELNTGFDNEETATRSYGYFFAEQRGIAITPEQALCLGTDMMNLAVGIVIQDEIFDDALLQAFSRCNIDVM